MGQVIAKLNEKYLTGEDLSRKQESKSMLHDVTLDDTDINVTTNIDGGDILNTPKTPPNAVKLRYDPRSPGEFDRTPIKVPPEKD